MNHRVANQVVTRQEIPKRFSALEAQPPQADTIGLEETTPREHQDKGYPQEANRCMLFQPLPGQCRRRIILPSCTTCSAGGGRAPS